jgi:hypothetical protein
VKVRDKEMRLKLQSRINRWCVILCGALSVLLCAAQVKAQVSNVDDLQKTVTTATTTTYFDLLKQVFPDAVLDAEAGKLATAHKTVAIDNLFGDYKSKVYEGGMTIGNVDAMWVRDGVRR